MTPINIAEYQTKRAALISEDRAFRPDLANATSRSVVELKADMVVRQIRALETSSVLARYDEGKRLFHGIEFLTGARLSLQRSNYF